MWKYEFATKDCESEEDSRNHVYRSTNSVGLVDIYDFNPNMSVCGNTTVG